MSFKIVFVKTAITNTFGIQYSDRNNTSYIVMNGFHCSTTLHKCVVAQSNGL